MYAKKVRTNILKQCFDVERQVYSKQRDRYMDTFILKVYKWRFF